MSFLIDPPWLYATGRLYGQAIPQRTPVARAIQTATAGAFLATSISLYLDRAWTRSLWKLCRAASGRDWMLNSGVFRFEHRRVGWRTHLLAALMFATYPLWLLLGERSGRAACNAK